MRHLGDHHTLVIIRIVIHPLNDGLFKLRVGIARQVVCTAARVIVPDDQIADGCFVLVRELRKHRFPEYATTDGDAVKCGTVPAAVSPSCSFGVSGGTRSMSCTMSTDSILSMAVAIGSLCEKKFRPMRFAAPMRTLSKSGAHRSVLSMRTSIVGLSPSSGPGRLSPVVLNIFSHFVNHLSCVEVQIHHEVR